MYKLYLKKMQTTTKRHGLRTGDKYKRANVVHVIAFPVTELARFSRSRIFSRYSIPPPPPPTGVNRSGRDTDLTSIYCRRWEWVSYTSARLVGLQGLNRDVTSTLLEQCHRVGVIHNSRSDVTSNICPEVTTTRTEENAERAASSVAIQHAACSTKNSPKVKTLCPFR